MNKKCLVVLLVLVLVVSGLSAKDSGFKLGGQLGWGFDIGKMKLGYEGHDDLNVKTKNNGFAFNLTGEYDFGKHWGVVANFGMMFAGKTTLVIEYGDNSTDDKSDERAGLYIDVALDAKYTCPITEKFSIAGLAGFELVSGYLLKDFTSAMGGMTLGSEPLFTDSDFYNVAFGLNLGVEGAYKIADKISVVGGVTGAWFFVNSFNSSKFVDTLKEAFAVSGIASFYIRPYVGATYSF